jgi:hypothetical protein
MRRPTAFDNNRGVVKFSVREIAETKTQRRDSKNHDAEDKFSFAQKFAHYIYFPTILPLRDKEKLKKK